MTLRSTSKLLLGLSLALPVIQAVLIWVGGLLVSMGDEAGAQAIRHVGTACQVVWAVCLVGLLIALAAVVLNEDHRTPPDVSRAPTLDNEIHD